MLRNQQLKEWSRVVSAHFPCLSLPQVIGLATWSFGIVMTNSSSLTRVSTFIARLNDERVNTTRQRLREWYLEAPAKCGGKKRAEIEVSQCFAPLLLWVLSLFPKSLTDLLLALDATHIGANLTILSLNVVFRGCGIPVAWCIVKATEPGAWKPHWLRLLAQLQGVVPPNWKVIVCADRGLYADWLFQAITALGWHPFLRINHQGTYRLPQEKQWRKLSTVVPAPGTQWSGAVTCFQAHSISCTLLATWDVGYKDPWLVLTDLPATQAHVLWYGCRCWIECSYRDFKSDGWKWHKTRLTDPQRAERHWLAMAVATLWVVASGHQDEDDSTMPVDSWPLSTIPPTSGSKLSHVSLSTFARGLLYLLADLLKAKNISIPHLFPVSLAYPTTVAVFNSS